MLRLRCYCVLVYLFSSFVFIYGGEEVDEDYYYGIASLRSVYITNKCKTDFEKLACQMKCPNLYICVKDDCLCVDKKQAENNPTQTLKGLYLRTTPEFVDKTVKDEESENEEYSLKPALRHHIAHFCPNLEVARTCIRTCMKTGKPAFCGKDHVCYCGHSYSKVEKNKGQDSQAMYAQFKDLYTKYFGENYMAQFSEEHH